MKFGWSLVSILSVLLFKTAVNALDMTVGDLNSMKDGLNKIAKGLMDYDQLYNEHEGKSKYGTPGMPVYPYYWWELGAAYGGMIDYWFYTGDEEFNSFVKKGMLFQAGSNRDYMPSNQTTTEGNDDQGFWGIAAMGAAERNFSNPKEDEPQWLELAQAVFNTMTARWDSQHCNGGLRWQIYTWNSGYDYKNTVSNGCLFQLGARLAKYTDNKTYSEWAEKVWDWIEGVEYLQKDFTLYDGGKIDGNCANHTRLQWTYNYGLFMSGAAYLYNHTGDQKWLDRAEGLWKASSVFFKNGVMYEAACQPSGQCNNDQRSFKGIFSRFCGLTAVMVPQIQSDIMEKLKSSASAAALSCSGGSDGHTCGLDWTQNKWDGKYGLGEQICALECIQNTLALDKPAPLTNKTGGTSKGNPNAGTSSKSDQMKQNELDITTKDRAGAGVLTTVIILGLVGTGFWMLK